MARNSNHYDGHPLLKAAGVKIEFTPEQLEEYIKCEQSCDYFLENYYQLVHPDHGLIPFHPYPYQHRISDAVVHNRYTIAKLPRQSGKTSIVAGVLLWHFLFNNHWTIAILANKEEQAKEILERIKLAYEHLPFWLQQGVVAWNNKSIDGENGSTIFAAATSSNAIRGRSINILMLDEFAFVDIGIQEEFFTSVFPTISSGVSTKLVITSTPCGMNLFYKLWTDSIKGRNNFVRVEAHWSEQPGRDEKWKEEQLKIMTPEKFSQEFETEFLGSSGTLISGKKLAVLTYDDPIDESHDHHTRVYQQPLKGRFYVLCADPAEGTNRDNSAIVIFDITEVPYRVVLTYTDNQISPLLLPTVIKGLAERYNQAVCLIEVNNQGAQVANILYSDLEYDNVIQTAPKGRSGLTISGGYTAGARLGIRTTSATKMSGCGNLKSLIEHDQLFTIDFFLYEELTRFVLHGKSYRAEEGTDDLVMCCVLFGWFQTQDYIRDNVNIDIRRNLYEANARALEDELTPVGIIDDGRDELLDEFEIRTVVSLDDWLAKA